MYVTRTYSQLLKNRESLSEHPEGPNSGFLVIKDEEIVETCCFGKLSWIDTKIRPPFPQNKDLNLVMFSRVKGDQIEIGRKPVILIPVLNQPLSSQRYYAIDPKGEHKGKAVTCGYKKYGYTNSMPLNPQNLYHQVKIIGGRSYYEARSVVADGCPPYFFQYNGYLCWWVEGSNPHHFELFEARGLDSTLRARLPNFNCPLLCKSTKPVIVGKWYSPFMFVKEGRVRDQVERSLYYEVTLEQRWEQVFVRKKNDENLGSSSITFDVEKEEVFITGNKAMRSEKNVHDGWILFTSYETKGGDLSVGLRIELVHRMKWEQERGGWKNGNDWKAKIDRVEEFKERRDWNEFGCYVLVERFNFRRMNGSLAMAYDFKHTHQIKTIWD